MRTSSGPNGGSRRNLQDPEGATEVDNVLRHAMCVPSGHRQGYNYNTCEEVVPPQGRLRALPDERGHVCPCHSARSRTQVTRASVPSVVLTDGVTTRKFSLASTRQTRQMTKYEL